MRVKQVSSIYCSLCVCEREGEVLVTSLVLDIIFSLLSGNYITAELIPENTYHLKFPGALAATVPLKS